MRKSFLLFAVVLLTFSCSSVVYYPVTANAPLFQEKDEVRLSLGIRGLGGDLHAACAIGQHLALMANANIVQFSSTEFETDYKNGQRYGDLAAGYFKPLGSFFVVESYAGAGAGSSYSENLNTGVLRTSDFYKAFLQVNAGFRWKYITLGVSARESFVHAAAPRYDGIVSGQAESDLFFEPALFLGIGPEKFRINAQAGLSYAHFVNISYSPFILSLGMETRFMGKK